MLGKNRMEYIIKTCSADDAQELQNLLNEMSMNGWDLYSMSESGEDDALMLNCIFMRESKSKGAGEDDIISISDFKSQIEKMLSPKLSEYDKCLELQAKIKHQKNQINLIKSELDKEAPATTSRKKLNDKISAGLRELDDLKGQLNKATSPDLMYSKLHEEKLAIYLSEELLGFIDSDRDDYGEEYLVAETVKSRLKLTENIGYVIPKVIFKDDEDLNPYEFCIKVRGIEVFKSIVYPKYKMYFADELHTEHKIKDSIAGVDALTDRKIIWVNKKLTKDFWQKGLTSSEYIARALETVAIRYVEDLLDYEDVEKYLDVVSAENEFLVSNIVPEILDYPDVKYIMACLIKEKVSIKNISYLFEKINDYAADSDRINLLSRIRLCFAKQICKKYENSDGESISAFELSEKTFSDIVMCCDNTDDTMVKIDGVLAEKLSKKIIQKSKKLNIYEPILVVPMDYRQMFYEILSLYVNNITVLALEELGCMYRVDSLGEI